MHPYAALHFDSSISSHSTVLYSTPRSPTSLTWNPYSTSTTSPGRLSDCVASLTELEQSRGTAPAGRGSRDSSCSPPGVTRRPLRCGPRWTCLYGGDTLWSEGRGVADGGGGRGSGPPLLKTAGVDPPEIWTFQYIFFLKSIFFCILQHFQNKVDQIRGETKLWG